MNIDIKSWWSKFKTEFKRRVLECHYRLVEFNKPETNARWWEIQRLDITGWKEVSVEYTEAAAINTLNIYVHQFTQPKETVVKEV